MNPNNPLKQYFRQPAIYIRLPSQGKNYPEGSLNMPPTGELAVYPMTAIDEITYRTPDALSVSYTHLTLPTNREV